MTDFIMMLYDRGSDYDVSQRINLDLRSILLLAYGDSLQPDPTRTLRDSETADSSQPWREFWPPYPGSLIYRQWEAEHPEVLSWSFSIDRLFDHPWHAWSSSVHVQKTFFGQIDFSVSCSSSRMSRQCSRVRPTANYFDVKDEMGLSTVSVDLRRATELLDKEIADLKLSFVRPTQFNYLAPLALYLREKPYKCQLPWLTGLRRSNICPAHCSVNIFDIAGHESLFYLASSGFQFVKCSVRLEAHNDLTVRCSYLPKMTSWLQTYLDCETVFIYDYNVSNFLSRYLIWLQSSNVASSENMA